MKTLLVLSAMTLSLNAQAAGGWDCESLDQDVRVKIAHTSDGALMIVSDPSVSGGRKTIARFAEEDGVLNVVEDERYSAKVDLRFNDSGRAGEYILGTRLGELSRIVLALDMDNADAYEAPATLTLTKRAGGRIRTSLICVQK